MENLRSAPTAFQGRLLEARMESPSSREVHLRVEVIDWIRGSGSEEMELISAPPMECGLELFTGKEYFYVIPDSSGQLTRCSGSSGASGVWQSWYFAPALAVATLVNSDRSRVEDWLKRSHHMSGSREHFTHFFDILDELNPKHAAVREDGRVTYRELIFEFEDDEYSGFRWQENHP